MAAPLSVFPAIFGYTLVCKYSPQSREKVGNVVLDKGAKRLKEVDVTTGRCCIRRKGIGFAELSEEFILG